MTEPIRGKVARILNSREMAINVGGDGGVTVGMRFDVMDQKGEDIRDPDTSELLGSVERPKVRVEISNVQKRLSVASTYKQEKVNVGGAGGLAFAGEAARFSRLFLPAKWETRYETLKTEEKTWEDLDEEYSYVKTGDPVVQVMDAADAPEESEQETTVLPEPEE